MLLRKWSSNHDSELCGRSVMLLGEITDSSGKNDLLSEFSYS